VNSKNLAKKARIHALQMVYKAKASHIASALSIIDILAVLYEGVLDIFPSEPENSNRDRFILSKGHACVGVYAVLAECGFFDKEMLATYGGDGSILMNHISHKVPGVEYSTGSLGHGLPFGVGKAFAAKKEGADWRTYVLMSDGEMQEGSNWEALMFAAHHKLDNIVAIIDYNNLQSLTTVDETLSIQPLNKKLNSFGWHVMEVDGHNHDALRKCFEKAKLIKNQPTIIIAKTIKGKGVSYMENRVEWHYKYPSEDELRVAMAELENA
jgi:transketolase